MYLHGSYFSVTFLPFWLLFATISLLFLYFLQFFCYFSATLPLQVELVMGGSVIDGSYPSQKVYSRGPGRAKPFWTILCLIFALPILDHICPIWTNWDQTACLDPSIWTRLFGPVFLDPSIWSHIFEPFSLDPVYLAPYICNRLFGPINLDPSIWTCILGLVFLDPSIWTLVYLDSSVFTQKSSKKQQNVAK